MNDTVLFDPATFLVVRYLLSEQTLLLIAFAWLAGWTARLMLSDIRRAVRVTITARRKR